MKRIQRVRNPYGIKVKKCCLSCQLKSVGLDGTSFCSKTGQEVKLNTLCKAWQMCARIKMSGCSRGGIKTQHYIEYVKNIREEEAEAMESGEEITPKSVKEIRHEYEEKYGSIYYVKQIND